MTDKDRIAKLINALQPFALMDREGEVKRGELACKRGVASDMTIITSQDFRTAADALKECVVSAVESGDLSPLFAGIREGTT